MTTRRPAGVPAEYLPTPNGYFHPSCVVTIGEDEVLGRDLVVRARDGSTRRTVPACAYPRYSALGRPIATEGAAVRGPTPDPLVARPAATFYDGWLISYWYTGALPPGTTVTGKWVVPPSPAADAVTGSDPVTIYYFDDVEMELGSAIDILQPVLGYGYPNGSTWAITSWNCCTAGIEATSAAVTVNPGDVILGSTVGTDCDASAACGTWTVTTTDVTTGQSTVLNTTEPDPPNIVNPGVLEAYGVTACDMLPPGGEETFYDHLVSSGDGGAVPLSYYTYAGGAADSPDCGYGGTSTGNDYTLIYGTSPVLTPTATALMASPTSAAPGATVTLTATITSTATAPAVAGNVTFYDGASSLGSVDVVPAVDGSGHETGTASLAISTLAGGTHTLTATFGGGSGYAASTSAPATVKVTQIPTTTTLAPSPLSANEGGSVILMATVAASGSAPSPGLTGTVTFYQGTKSLGATALVPSTGDGGAPGGTAALSTTASAIGMDGFQAKYGGDTAYLASTSSIESVTVAGISVTPASPVVAPLGAVAFSAAGGSGTGYAWSLATNASGGSLGASTGAYVAGGTGGTDAVQVTDSLGNTAQVQVTVFPTTTPLDAASPTPNPGQPGDSGAALGVDAASGIPLGEDASVATGNGDAGSGRSGCACVVGPRGGRAGERPAGALVAVAAALGFAARRRRRGGGARRPSETSAP